MLRLNRTGGGGGVGEFRESRDAYLVGGDLLFSDWPRLDHATIASGCRQTPVRSFAGDPPVDVSCVDRPEEWGPFTAHEPSTFVSAA